MSRAALFSTVSVAALLAAMPVHQPQHWYGAIDAGFHTFDYDLIVA
jgi:hypothetical protein